MHFQHLPEFWHKNSSLTILLRPASFPLSLPNPSGHQNSNIHHRLILLSLVWTRRSVSWLYKQRWSWVDGQTSLTAFSSDHLSTSAESLTPRDRWRWTASSWAPRPQTRRSSFHSWRRRRRRKCRDVWKKLLWRLIRKSGLTTVNQPAGTQRPLTGWAAITWAAERSACYISAQAWPQRQRTGGEIDER